MALDLNAIKAAAAKLQQANPTPNPSPERGGESVGEKKSAPKTKGGASYVIPAEFKQAIENHLKGRADMADKLNKPGKTIDGCCDYIFDVMRKRAEKARNGKSAVGLYADPNEIFGLAVHYYDESEESLKNEKTE